MHHVGPTMANKEFEFEFVLKIWMFLTVQQIHLYVTVEHILSLKNAWSQMRFNHRSSQIVSHHSTK